MKIQSFISSSQCINICSETTFEFNNALVNVEIKINAAEVLFILSSC